MRLFLIKQQAAFQIGEWRVFLACGAQLGLVEVQLLAPGSPEPTSATLRLQERLAVGPASITLLRVGTGEFRIGIAAPREVRFYEVPALIAEPPPAPPPKWVVTLPSGHRLVKAAPSAAAALLLVEQETKISATRLNVQSFEDVLEQGESEVIRGA